MLTLQHSECDDCYELRGVAYVRNFTVVYCYRIIFKTKLSQIKDFVLCTSRSRVEAFVQDTRHALTHTFGHVHVRKRWRVRVAFNDEEKVDAAETGISILIVVTSLSNRILHFR